MPPRPHKLDLYRLSVQHPEAEVAFLLRAYAHYNRGRRALLLKEDFCGTAAVAQAWVAHGPDRQALAVDTHGPTLRWAARRAQDELGVRRTDLHLLHADVRQVTVPRVDVVAALNFSVLGLHEPATLLTYLRAARRSLRPGGLLVLDVYGGPSALRPGTQRRRVVPPADEAVAPFEYHWVQESYDAVPARTRCRIDFRLGPRQAPRRLLRGAFRYDWRLWTLPELTQALGSAGFARAQVWWGPAGRFRPVRRMPDLDAWVAYVIGATGV